MSKLSPVHGFLDSLVNRIVPEGERAAFTSHARGLAKRLELTPADKSTFDRFADGGLSPLTGPMNEDVYNRVLERGSIVSRGQEAAWTIPLSFPMTDAEAQTIAPGDEVAVYCEGNLLGTLAVESVFNWDKVHYNTKVYGTERTDHPGARIANSDPRTKLCGGTIRALPSEKSPHFGAYVLSPTETRSLFADKKYDRVVAFQTRNPLHRAHEYALVFGAEALTREGHYAGVVLNPLVGETKGDDVDGATRMRTYANLVQHRLLGQGDKDEALWAARGYDLNDVFHLIALDIKMFYAGPKEAVMHAIYRQNFGFTDIIIGRKHADAPYDDGSAIWGDFDAQTIFDNLGGHLAIKPLNVGFAAYYESIGRVDLMDSHPNEKPLFVSGKDVRAALLRGERPDARIMRPETADILIEKMKV
jgi:sulfate adenylyltransferase